LIVFEGIDGSGKTTQIGLLSERLCRAAYEVVTLKEPTDGPWGQKIRRLFSRGREGISKEIELSWFLNDRRDHVAHDILPALKRHQIVLIDRYYFSTMAYQGALGLDAQAIQAQNEAFAPPPDLMLLLQITPEDSIPLVRQRSVPNAFEKLDYLKRVAAVFDRMQFPYLRRIDATQTIDQVHQCIWQAVEPLLRSLAESTS
jgi:dTMP kinase